VANLQSNVHLSLLSFFAPLSHCSPRSRRPSPQIPWLVALDELVELDELDELDELEVPVMPVEDDSLVLPPLSVLLTLESLALESLVESEPPCVVNPPGSLKQAAKRQAAASTARAEWVWGGCLSTL